MSKIVISVLLAGLLLALGCSRTDQDSRSALQDEGQSILKKHLQQIGGQELANSFRTRFIQGLRISERPNLGLPIVDSFRVWADSSGHWRFETADESFGFDAQGGWIADSGGVRMDPYQVRSKLGFVFDPGGYAHFDRYFKHLAPGQPMVMNYRQLRSLNTDRDTTYYTLWFDKETALLSHIGFHWNLKDYQQVDNLLMPHLIEEGHKGGVVKYQFDRVLHDQPIPEDHLRRPIKP